MNRAVLSADGKRLAATHNAHAHIFDTGTLKQIWKTEELSGKCDFLSLSGDGRWLAAAPWGQDATLWDLRARQEVRKLTNSIDVAFSPDGRWLAHGRVLGRAMPFGIWPTGHYVRLRPTTVMA